MVLACNQIVNLACAIAKAPGMITQAGQFFNVILNELAELNDFELSRGLWTVNTAAPAGVTTTSSIPYYNLAPDHLRVLEDGVFYLVDGVPMTLIQKQLSEFDQLVNTPSIQSQLLFYAVDDSSSPPTIMFWPSNSAYTVNVRYIRLLPDIVTPENSSAIPWFPLQQYLIDELAARMMSVSDDVRQEKFHDKASKLLRKWLIMQRDMESTTLRVKLDRNRFGSDYSSLKDTKAIGSGFG